MKGIGWWACWSVLAGYRLLQVATMMVAGSLVGWLLFVPELVALGLGIANGIVAKDRDYRLKGLWVPFCYAAGVFIISGHALNVSPVAFVLYMIAEAVSVWALLCLGVRFSVAGSAWVSLCEKGPYRWVRHPQLLARCLFIVACTVPVGHWVSLGMALLMTVSVVLVEEQFLMTQDEYQDYSGRTRYRLIPGVF